MSNHEIAVEICEYPVLLRTQDPAFRDLLAHRYEGFLSLGDPKFEFDVELVSPDADMESDDDVEVRMRRGLWDVRRGDFRAEWDPRAGRGRIRQSANPYSIDSVLRIVHTLVLAKSGGFLLHAASAIRNGKAFLFSGISGAGKTTISRLAPSDAILLTDEISYVRRTAEGYHACGTPFAGELARSGQNSSAPIHTLFFLEKGDSNRIELIDSAESIRRLMRNILFFAEDPELVKDVFRSACEFIERIPVRQLFFLPDERVWDLVV
jgi:hypothetical protein